MHLTAFPSALLVHALVSVAVESIFKVQTSLKKSSLIVNFQLYIMCKILQMLTSSLVLNLFLM